MGNSNIMGSVPRFPERESKSVEFKLKLDTYQSMAKTCVAFANCQGGTILVGIEDGTRIIKGISEVLIDKYFEEVPRALLQLITPNLTGYPFEQNINGKTIFGITIYSGDNKPYYITSEGRLKGVYVRVGSHSMRANDQYLQELRLFRENRSYDQTLEYRLRWDALDTGLIRQTLSINRLDEGILESHHIVGRDRHTGILHPTLGGILLFHPSPENYIPEAFIACARMKGNQGRDIIETRDFTGPLVVTAESVISYLSEWLERDYKLIGAKLKGHQLVPPDALREGILNAVLHRKYNLASSLKITLWQDRLEIFSPGGFVGLMHPDDLGNGTSTIRNRVLCSIARKARLIEKRGTGIRLILDSCKAHGGVTPEFEEGSDWVKLTFRFISRPVQPRTTHDQINVLIANNEIITNRMVVQTCKVSRQTANKLLQAVTIKGILVQDGQGRGRKYLRV